MAKEVLECSFCGRKKPETNLLIAGINAHICDKCIEQAHGIVLEELKQSKKHGGLVTDLIIKKQKEIRADKLNFFASSRKLANPISVYGCFNKPKIESSGQVQTSAPAAAHLMIWFGLRIEAASISVLYPCMS